MRLFCRRELGEGVQPHPLPTIPTLSIRKTGNS